MPLTRTAFCLSRESCNLEQWGFRLDSRFRWGQCKVLWVVQDSVHARMISIDAHSPVNHFTMFKSFLKMQHSVLWKENYWCERRRCSLSAGKLEANNRFTNLTLQVRIQHTCEKMRKESISTPDLQLDKRMCKRLDKTGNKQQIVLTWAQQPLSQLRDTNIYSLKFSRPRMVRATGLR